jgi:hypothetical protein
VGFDSGPISFQRYAVVGQSPKLADEAVLARFAEHAFRATDIGVPEEVEYGWAGPRHALDDGFGFEHCVFNDCVHVALRVDTNKVPAELKRAFQSIEEAAVAAGNPSGFISKQQKRDVKDQLARKLDSELRSGKYRRTKLHHVLWDVPAGILYAPASPSVREKLMELFSRTFALDLQPLTSGTIALRTAEANGQRRAYEDFAPTRFAPSRQDPGTPAEYPWTAKGDNAKDWLGNEFLLWLWYYASHSPVIRSDKDLVAVMFDRSLQVDCVYGQSGKDVFTGTAPTSMSEARDALRQGKVPRKAGLVIESAAGLFHCTLAAETLAIASLKLPDVEEADTPRALFEERITLLRDFTTTIEQLYEVFLAVRLTVWDAEVAEIRKWIKS